jgi:uncharacterized membrane protein
MASTDPGGPAPRSGGGRALRIALAVSLALNLAVAGVVGGTLLAGVGHPPRPVVRDLGFGPFGQALSADDRAALRAAFEAEAPDMRRMRREVRADLARLLAALRAEPFDAAALRAALEAQGAHARERLDLGQRLLADRLIAMSVAERQAYADRLQAAQARGRGEGGRADRGPGDDARQGEHRAGPPAD